jgi:hypothetical protein
LVAGPLDAAAFFAGAFLAGAFFAAEATPDVTVADAAVLAGWPWWRPGPGRLIGAA